jgi:hypothetical protein
VKGIYKNTLTPSKEKNLQIMGIEKGEVVQTKGTHNVFNKIITKNFTNLEKVMLIQVQKASTKQTIKIEPPHDILSLKQQAQRIEKEYLSL